LPSFVRFVLCLLAVGLSLNLPACSHAAKSSLRANQDAVNTNTAASSAEKAVDAAMQTGVMLMSKLMAQEQDKMDGPQPSKASLKLSDTAGDLFYTSYGKLKLARMAAETAVELLEMNDKTKFVAAADNLDDAKKLEKEGSDMLKQGHDNLNKAYEGSPDVDPQAKVWSEAGSMARRAGSMQRDVQAMISKANRKAPRGFNLMQMKVTSGFKEVKEKTEKVEAKKNDEDSLVSYIENYPSLL